MELLQVEARDERGWTVLSVRGQLDVATAPDLRQALVEAQYGRASRVVLDLDGLEFMDSMGLGVIVGGLKRAHTHDGELALVCTRERVRHLLTITRIAEIVRVVPSVGDLPDA